MSKPLLESGILLDKAETRVFIFCPVFREPAVEVFPFWIYTSSDGTNLPGLDRPRAPLPSKKENEWAEAEWQLVQIPASLAA